MTAIPSPTLTDLAERPKRIQRKRTAGWKMPPNTINVARPSVHGNKYRVGKDGDAAECVAKFRANWEYGLAHPLGKLALRPTLEKLRGKNLACWCRLDQPCHADVLLDLANAPSARAASESSHG
jgi:Domain of unknown function (DUF4326)